LEKANAVFLAPVAHQVTQLADWQVQYLVHSYQHLFWKNRQTKGGRKNN
jgi:hypothetical protein